MKTQQIKDTHSRHMNKKKKTITNSTEAYAQGHNPRSKANLKPWKPKQSGNPLGRPSHAKLRKMLKEIGDEMVYGYKEEPLGTNRELLLKKIWEEARRGRNIKYIQLLMWLGVLDD